MEAYKVDFDSLNVTLKINWLKSLLNSKNFYHIPQKIFMNLGGIDFFF